MPKTVRSKDKVVENLKARVSEMSDAAWSDSSDGPEGFYDDTKRELLESFVEFFNEQIEFLPGKREDVLKDKNSIISELMEDESVSRVLGDKTVKNLFLEEVVTPLYDLNPAVRFEESKEMATKDVEPAVEATRQELNTIQKIQAMDLASKFEHSGIYRKAKDKLEIKGAEVPEDKQMTNILSMEDVVGRVVGVGEATREGKATRDDKKLLKDCITNLIAGDRDLEPIVKKHLGKIIRDAFAKSEIKVEAGIAQRFSDLMRDDKELKVAKTKLKDKGIDLEAMVAKMKKQKTAGAGTRAPSAAAGHSADRGGGARGF